MYSKPALFLTLASLAILLGASAPPPPACDAPLKDPVLFTVGAVEATQGSSGRKVTLGQKTTRDFSSGDIEVHFTTQVYGRSVTIQIASTLSSREFLEALASLRTAKTLGAREIILSSPYPLTQVKIEGVQGFLPLEALFAAAGAQRISEGTSKAKAARFLTPQTKPLLTEDSPRPDAVVMSTSYVVMGQSIAVKSGLPFVSYDSKKLPENQAVYLVANLGSNSNFNIVEALSLISELKVRGNTVTLISPYLPYARSDKVDHPGEATVGGRLIADLFETVETDGILFIRAHAPQTQGFYRFYSENMKGAKTLFPVLKELGIDQILSPDEGAAKENGKFARELGVSTNMLNKVRDPKTGQTKIGGIQDLNVAGHRVACLDDELDTGGTSGNGADLLKSKGATFYAVVATHLTGNALKALDNPNVDMVIVTDTVPIKFAHPKLRVVSVAGELAAKISELEEKR